MFSTTRPPWQYHWPTSNPTIPRPALHDARYEGWPHPSLELPQVASPSSTTRHVSLAIDVPLHRLHEANAAHTQPRSVHPQCDARPRTNFWPQACTDIMGPVGSQRREFSGSLAWNGGTHSPSLQGTSEMRSTTNTRLILYDHSALRTMTSNVNEIQKAYPHPFLATPSMSLTYDLRFPPTSLGFPSSSPYAGCGHELLRVPLTPERPRHIRLISPNFPWAFDIGPDPSVEDEVVSCLDVLATLHAALQLPLTDAEWATTGYNKRASLIRARGRRLALRGSSNSAARTRPTVRFTLGTYASNHRPVQRESPLLRVDWLGSRVAFMGLVKDEAFARSRLIPGGGEPPETWVIRFQRL
ncbi:hypothetical protein DEU56DRAFT_806397 [Suillus clintonianus]|uniref:uncharacterized protein n=1 Tax=Suillus clintonianus TaxID=1904413 RepID=UPI001B868E40|nr:uncharacterized protein DEU56DRAFT_806397 [Suillus clintonianus]KAG2135765.1 hypothetical protein DEU56DRAFT_806397 [Suillus clintonianus]